MPLNLSYSSLRLRSATTRLVSREQRRGLACWFGFVFAMASAAAEPPVSAASVDLSGRPSLGAEKAAVTVLEISSFGCSHCAEFHRSTFPSLRQQFIDSGLVRWVVLNASDDPAEQHAKVFAVARALNAQGQYWANLDLLFQVGRRSSSFVDKALAKVPNLDAQALAAQASSFAIRQAVVADFQQLTELKLPGTPVFIISKVTADGRRIETRIEGAETLDHFRRTFEAVLQAP